MIPAVVGDSCEEKENKFACDKLSMACCDDVSKTCTCDETFVENADKDGCICGPGNTLNKYKDVCQAGESTYYITYSTSTFIHSWNFIIVSF